MSVVRTGANMTLLSQTQAARAPAQAAGITPSVSGDWRAPARVRLGTLNNLRWLAVVGQATALLFVRIMLNFDFQLVLCSTIVAASAILNVILAIGFPSSKRLTLREATAFLAYDTTQLAALLFLTGGIENPFALLFLAPVVVSAATLNVKSTLFLGGLTFVAIALLAYDHVPLPWNSDVPLRLPPLYQFGIVISLILGIGFTSVYAFRIADEATRMSAALTATQLALAREHRLASLGGLAAAAAHQLGTPLGTIALVARELERELATSAHGDDFRLLRAEAERCRAILTRLAQPEESVLGQTERLPLGALLDDIAAPHRGVDVTIVIDVQAGTAPNVWRMPEVLHGLGNLVENAADFAAREVRLRARWNDNELRVEVVDDGPGFAAQIFEQIGEPYVTSRPRRSSLEKASEPDYGKQEGMGLGFFIAKTLIEQTSGTLIARNRSEGGAVVTARWPRGAIDGEAAPRREFQL
jgi:two-component system sensor histidine kinase RegB